MHTHTHIEVYTKVAPIGVVLAKKLCEYDARPQIRFSRKKTSYNNNNTTVKGHHIYIHTVLYDVYGKQPLRKRTKRVRSHLKPFL